MPNSSAEPIRAAVIGLGPHGRRVVDVLNGMPNVQLTAVVDRREEALAYGALPAETVRCRSLEGLWGLKPIDLVCVVTNGPSHAPLAAEAIRHGAKHLMIAKPLACSLAECDQIISSASAAGVRVAVDHVRRHAPAYQWLKEQIGLGRWGQPRCLWMQRPGIGLGCNATHSFDAIRFLTGREVRSVTGWVDAPIGANPRGAEFVDPGGLVVLELNGNLRAVVAQIEDGAGPTTLEIDLTAARIRMDERSGEIEVIERDTRVATGPGKPPVYRRAELPAGLTGKVDMHAGLNGLFEDLLGTGPIACDAQEGRASIAILAAAYLSQRTGHQPVTLSQPNAALLELWMPVT